MANDDNDNFRVPLFERVPFTGNLTRDPRDISPDKDGSRIAFDVAVNYVSHKEEGVRFINVICFREWTSKNAMRSLVKGSRVDIVGDVFGDSYENDDGDTVEKLTCTAYKISLNLNFGAYERLAREDNDDDEDEKPRRSSRRRSTSDDDEEEKPRRSSRRRRNDDDEDDEEEKPKSRSRRSRVRSHGDDDDDPLDD